MFQRKFLRVAYGGGGCGVDRFVIKLGGVRRSR